MGIPLLLFYNFHIPENTENNPYIDMSTLSDKQMYMYFYNSRTHHKGFNE